MPPNAPREKKANERWQKNYGKCGREKKRDCLVGGGGEGYGNNKQADQAPERVNGEGCAGVGAAPWRQRGGVPEEAREQQQGRDREEREVDYEKELHRGDDRVIECAQRLTDFKLHGADLR